MRGAFERLVVPISGSEADARALDVLPALIGKEGGAVTFLYVVEVPQSMPLDAELPDEIERGEQVLRNAELFASRCVGGKRENIRTELLQARSAGAAIVDEAIESAADSIMLSCSIRKKFGRTNIGDVVEYALLNAPCEVIVIRRPMSSWNTDDEGRP